MKRIANIMLLVFTFSLCTFAQEKRKPFPEKLPTEKSAQTLVFTADDAQNKDDALRGEVLEITPKDVQSLLKRLEIRSPKDIRRIAQSKAKGKSVDVVWLSDVVYESKSGVDLTLQILLPFESLGKERLPLVAYVPGSAWFKQQTKNAVPNMARFAKRGFCVAVVEYRHSGIATFPAQTIDDKNAVRFMLHKAKAYGVDERNVLLWGDSSGAHTSLFVAVGEGNAELDDPIFPDIQVHPNAVVAYYPPTDLSKVKDIPTAISKGEATSAEGWLIGKKAIAENMDLAQKASPNYYVSPQKPLAPIMIATGTRDSIVPFEQSDLMAHCLADNGKAFNFYAIKDADHGSWEFWTKRMYDLVEAFFRANLVR